MGKERSRTRAFTWQTSIASWARRPSTSTPAIPPPDLWIEVDNRASSRGRLPVYAELGVPEVWRYHARRRKLWFGRLTERGVFEPIEQSVSLRMLTSALVLEALALGEGQSGGVWYRRLKEWI